MQDCKNRPERLDKLLASSGLVTRSEARAAVARGRVTVDGVPAHSPEQKVTREAALCLDGAPVDTAPFLYIMLNKPAGYVCSTDDGDGPTVLDLLTGPERRRGLFPAGRLDKDTVGLLLLTNDGASAHRWLSPKQHVEKRYFFRCARPLDESAAALLERGVDIGGVVTKPARAAAAGEAAAAAFEAETRAEALLALAAPQPQRGDSCRRTPFVCGARPSGGTEQEYDF